MYFRMWDASVADELPNQTRKIVVVLRGALAVWSENCVRSRASVRIAGTR